MLKGERGSKKEEKGVMPCGEPRLLEAFPPYGADAAAASAAEKCY